MTLDDIMLVVREFVEERDWTKFQKPRALAISAAIEMGELLELFQWRTDKETTSLLEDSDYRGALADEIADVMIYLIRIADTAGISPTAAILKKMTSNREKYPAEEYRGKRPEKFK
ncbi:nucleotide pyrophosphohydrolase [Candidatus Thorarchaeota archaeon]|jgi:NTP pyrophosphatase (non-canonical NTP hydrolase)|nr:MAG: nucleotide pyrophosphohydrolase [Candidatus Thorarchaeota archaeon]